MGIELIYWICFVFGLGYGLFGLLGELLGSHVAGEHQIWHDAGSGHEFDSGHDVASGHDAAAGGDVSPLNSITITAFLLSFGALGLLGVYGLGLAGLGSLLFAITTGIALASVFFLAFVRTVYRSQSSSSPRLTDVINATGSITVAVPAGGTGEISYVAGGSRFTMPAREDEGRAIERGQRVAILRVERGVAYVVSLGEQLSEPAESRKPLTGQ